jgi:predicted DNA-binding protein (MmcQ/YjbR family)
MNKRSNEMGAQVLEKMRLVCLDFPETNEHKAWGHPNFRAGKKTFAVLETYKGVLSIAMKVGTTKQRQLLRDGRFYETPYVGKQGWISLKVDTSTLKRWREVNDLLLSSYKNVALKRMLQELGDPD